MPAGHSLCKICGNIYPVSWGDPSPICNRRLSDQKRAEEKGIALPGVVRWLIALASSELISEAVQAYRKEVELQRDHVTKCQTSCANRAEKTGP